MPPAPLLAVPVAAALAAGLIGLLRPLLVRYALARPNARSSHSVPTPQGGGIAVVVACLAVAGCMPGTGLPDLVPLAMAATGLALLGAWDDIRPLPAGARLLAQALLVGTLVLVTPGRIAPGLPSALECGLAILAGLWFVNLTNFMDGLDWMTVAEMVPVCGALLAFGLAGRLPFEATLVAGALLGALLGFAPFNRPVARLFLGDVGSLPVGLIVAWLLFALAAGGGLAAALLLPLYYVADSTLTLVRRAGAREPVWQAHRSHYYQRATGNDLSVTGIVGRVFGVNLGLAALAAATLAWPHPAVAGAALAAGAGAVALLLHRFGRQPQARGGRTA